MRRLLRVLAVSVMVLALVPAVRAQGYYGAVGAGPGKTSDTNDGREGDEDPSAHKTGFTGSALLGYRWQPELGAEAEFGYIYAPVKSDGDVPLGGSVKSYLLMANLRYEARLAARFKPYIGAGLGYARVLHADEFTDFFDQKKTAHQWRGAFAYQARAGVAYEVSPTLDLSLGYRYIHVNSGSVEQQQGSSEVRVNFDAIRNHSLEVGLSMKF